MSREAEEVMNNMTVFEARMLHYALGYTVVIGNGQVCSIVPENEAQDEEDRRCANGY